MGYGKQRMEWWVDRSKSPEYQKAYDRIKESLKAAKGDIIVDFGCGTGEMLRRLYDGDMMLVGTDETAEMLQMASENLGRYGIKSKIIGPGYRTKHVAGSVSKDEVLLVLDDYLNSGLPSSFADKAISTFPEISRSSQTKLLSSRRGAGYLIGVGARLSRIGPVVTDIDAEIVKQEVMSRLEAARDLEIYRILKEGGVYTAVDYDYVKPDRDRSPEEAYLDSIKEYMRILALDTVFEITGLDFFPEKDIGDDATLGSGLIEASTVKGYGILTQKKI